MARIRTLNFLPEVFKTPSNSEFLAATLDQIVNPPVTQKIQGYVGSKLGYGINANDKYVPEPTKERIDYQLEPGVVFTKTNESVAKDFITYPGILNSIGIQGGITDDNSRLFQSQFYSWDSFCNLDPLINYNQYYWLPDGPPAVTVANSTVYQNENFIVTDLPNSYQISLSTAGAGSINPTLTLLRGGTYTFTVNQDTQFWIQGEPGVTGYSLTQPNQPVRDVYGVSNNGASDGVITFNVPAKDAQDEYEFANTTNIDIVCDVPFDQINGQHLSAFQNIDGVTGLEGLRIMFYDTGIINEQGYTSSYFNETYYDTNQPGFVAATTLTLSSCTSSLFTLASGDTTDLILGQTVTFNEPVFGGVVAGQVYFINSIPSSTTFSISTELNGTDVVLTAGSGSMVANTNQGLLEDGYYSTVADNFYEIQYVGALADPLIRLVPVATIPQDTKIIPNFGTVYGNRGFYKNAYGEISLIPYISAPLNILYYQDGTNPDKVGVLRLIESNYTNSLNVVTDILGHPNYTSRNGVQFTNGLKVRFDGDVIPTRYLQDEYYVQGVGTAIELVPVSTLICPEKFTQGEYIAWDTAPYDIGNYEENLYVPVIPDYITISRNSLSKNAWSRSNRWFHIDVIKATATYNNNPSVVNLASGDNKAKRPIIEFYPNIKLMNSGIDGKRPVDFIDTRTTDALSTVAGALNYYPDVEVYTTATATISSATGTSTTVTVPVAAVTGNILNYMYIADSANILPNNALITSLTSDGTTYTMTVTWETSQTLVGDTNISLVMSATPVNNYNLFPGARIIFAADTDLNVRNKIYVSEFSVIEEGTAPVITLTVAEDGNVSVENQVVAFRGYAHQGLSYWFNGSEWIEAQQKLNINQAPLFDIFDENGISFGDNDYYIGTSFVGCTLFAYQIGSGAPDPVLTFPIKYSSVSNVGDISFDVSINSNTFNYTRNGNPITENVNTGYVYNYTSPSTHIRQLGWETAIAPSTQYQVFYFDYVLDSTIYLSCDVAALPELTNGAKGWPRVKVYYNNVYQEPGTDFSYTTTEDSTTIQLINTPSVDTPIQVLILSDQVSNIAYYDVPINLTNNPLNQSLTSVNIGDIRPHYESIFVNAPNTTGTMFGANNFRDCGDILPYGTSIIQNSASLVLPGAFLRSPAHNVFDALLFNSREYIIFKQLLVDTVQNTDYVQRFTPAQILDDALDQITAARSEINAFFWSDMLPNKTPYISNTYVFNNDLDNSIYPLSKVYNFDSANYDGVLVYLRRKVAGINIEKQLLSGVEYEVSKDSPSVRITIPMLNGDNVIIKEYNQTYGSYVPNTPTKLGLYPAFEPAVVLDSNYMVPTYFIRGHDGSYTKLYGDYNEAANILIDFRDQALLEFETRIYNNLKLSENVVIRDYEVLPGYFRQSDATYTYNEFLEMYSTSFLNWIGQNRLDYKTQYFSKVNEYTYNYTNSANKIDQVAIEQGYWRGVYQYFYDTFTPDTTPWEMLGFSIMPDWWTTRYGPAPYTSNNLVLWDDLENGYVWNNGNPYIIPQLVRPGLSKIIPVDSSGNLLSPFKAVMGNYNPSTFQKDWRVGDIAPVELSYRRSSSWPFDLVRLFALTRPAEFYNLAVDLDNYKYNEEFNQYLVNNRSHLVLNNIEVYGNGTATTSYINWIVDYEKQQGIDATTNITDMLDNLDVRLVYRLAGFSDKTMLDFFVEKGSPSSKNSSLMIPDESYSVLLYDNQAFDKIVFSGVIIQQNNGYWTVYGNSQTFAYFEVINPLYNGKYKSYKVENLTVKVATEYETNTTLVPYGTKFYTAQDVARFLLSYGACLESKGMVFDSVQNGVHVTWVQMVLEFLYWTQQGWENGSIITLNPAAQDMNINGASTVVQPLTLHQQNFILNQNLYPIKLNDLCVNRDGTNFNVHTLNDGDTMAYAQFNLNNFEHGIVFDNVTLFNDVLYSTVTGLRQHRIFVRGVKTAEWDGTVNAYGFILNQDNVQEYNGFVKYTKGVIVKYKNKYWTSLKIIEPSGVFNEQEWKEINYNDVQKGLLPNASTRAYESTLYYDVYNANLEQDADLLSYSLIGYRPRDYLALVDLTDTAQVQVYKNMIKNKGTSNSVNAFKGANLPQGGIKYDVYENWAIQSGTYGGVLNENFVEFKVNQNYMTGDPAIVSLTNGVYTSGAMQEVPLANLYNYGTAPTDPNILSTTTDYAMTTMYPSAGYVNYDDVKMASYFYSGLPYAVNTYNTIIPIQNFYVGEYLWLANFKEQWEVFRWKTIGQVINVRANTNQTATITFNVDHNLKKNDPMSIVNFAVNVDGYYLVVDVVNLREVIINLNLIGVSNNALQGRGLGFAFESQRVATPSEIASLNLTENEFVKNTVWVDENYDGSWAVYRKSINYQSQGQLDTGNYGTYGSAVAYTSNAGYFISDPSLGEVYRYGYDGQNYNVNQTLTSNVSFGTAIAYAGNIYVVSQPTATLPDTARVNLYVLNPTRLTDDLIPYQRTSPGTPGVYGIERPSGVTDWGSKLAISDDSNWLYISDVGHSKIYVYRKQHIPLIAGYFTIGETYTITSVGTTDFTSIGAVDNLVGITFIATGVGSGTGTATQVTYKYANVIDGGLSSTDLFGNSIATNYNGNTLVVGAPIVDDRGAAYVYSRTEQNYEAPYNSVPYQPQSFTLAWTPSNIAGTNGTSVTSSQYVNVSSTSGMAVNMPIMFTGTNFGSTGINPYTIYYVAEVHNGTQFSIKATRNTSTPLTLVNAAGLTYTAYAQSNPLYVYINGVLVDDSNYATVGNRFYYTGTLRAGDIVNVSDSGFHLTQEFTSNYNDRTDLHYGTSVDITRLGSDIVIGSPFEIDTDNNEGAVYSYVNGGARYGVVIGANECNVTTSRTVLINGFAVPLTAGDATAIAAQINNNNINNIVAAATSDNKLMIQIVVDSLGPVEQKLLITAFSDDVLTELGIDVYTNTQIILCPHEKQATQFGYNVKINEQKSLIVAAPSGIRYEGTVFDFTDDENLDNDTVFDNNATQFVDNYPNAGAVYMFDYLSNYNESLSNPGAYAYAQSVNDDSLDYGYDPQYGFALEFNENVVIVGSPNFQSATVGGKANIFNNIVGVTDWLEYRQSAPVVDINKIQNSQLFSAETNQTLVNFDYPDPLQNKLLGAARENLDYVTGVDPANYNVNYAPQSGIIWGADHVGKMWFNTTNVRWFNYHQNDVTYNSRHWAQVFPGSDVAVYTWIASYVLPLNYQGPGVPFDVNQYVVGTNVNASGIAVPIYYFWVRNTNIIFDQIGKTLSDAIVAAYISSPRISGIPFIAPLLPNTFALYNSGQYINANDSVFHIGFANGTTDDVSHTEYTLIRYGYRDDFLPGYPDYYATYSNSVNASPDEWVRRHQSLVYGVPYSLYAKMLDSMSGCDISGQVVPNPLLPAAVQQGVLNIPRQGFFYNRYLALNNYLSYANTIMSEYPIAEMKEELGFLFTSGEYYNTTDYWEYVNWYAPGYSNSSKTSIQVPIYGDLASLNAVPIGTLVKVEKNGAGKYEIYHYDGLGVWTRVGLENGTIQFKTYLWDYAAGKIGYSGNFFDTDPFDVYPSEETRSIIRALNEQIYTGELLIHRNKSLILLFEYIQAETIESQNYLPWLNKTSLVDVSHTIRELKPYEVYKTDDQVFLSEYINEVKPYHVVIKDYLLTYTGMDIYEGDITDFDVPATYNSSELEFISPQMVYTIGTNSEYEYTYTDNIWQTAPYTQWYQNFGLTFGTPQYSSSDVLINYLGQKDYPITKLSSYVTLSTKFMIVENASGFPINGVVTIGKEKISYSYVDKALNLLGGLTRGINNTPVEDHLPTEQLYIDLPAVILLSGGRGYNEPPRITAVIDTTKYPEPMESATFQAVMSLDTVIAITVTNPGKGYATLPEIVIEPSITATFDNTNVVSAFHTLSFYAPQFRTGDLVQYKAGTGAGCGRLSDGEWYYVNVLESTPNTIIALYTTYRDAVNDNHRVPIIDIGNSVGMTLNLGAKAFAITSSTPTRENNTSIKFDRTSYQSQVKDWEGGAYYGAYYAGSYYNTDKLSSSNIKLESANPDINDLLASAHAVVFEIADVENEQQLSWSSFERQVESTSSTDNYIRLVPVSKTFVGTASISGTTMNVISLSSGTVTIGTYVYGEYVDSSTQILSQLSGSPGGTGLYEVSISQTSTNGTVNGYEPNVSGGTLGFYKNMPVKFIGGLIGGIQNNVTYYVDEILNDIDFTISDDIDGTTKTLTTGTTTIPMYCYTGNISNQAVLTVNYPGILYPTATTETINSITIPMSAIGTGGTNGFYPGASVFFTATNPGEEVFGNIIENQVYYINTVVDEEHVTISETNISVLSNVDDEVFTTQSARTIYSTTVTDTTSGTDIVTVDSTADFAVNDKIIFNSMVVSGSPVTTFGNIVSGSLYYVQAIVSDTQMKIATSINSGTPLALGTASGTATVTNQKNTVVLSTATGIMTMNVALPVSPGQVDGQAFKLYQTSGQYTGITDYTISNLLNRTVYAAIGTNFSVVNNRLAVDSTTWFYDNMPFQLQDTVGGLSAFTTYYVKDYSGQIIPDPENPGQYIPRKNIYIVASQTVAGTGTPGTNLIVCSIDYDTSSLYEGMGIVFSGVGLGGINIGQEYYVSTIVNSTSFTISEIAGGAEKLLTTNSGTMAGTGSPYITVSSTTGGADITLTTSAPYINPVELDQIITSNPTFDISYLLGGYTETIENGGTGFAITNKISISGDLVGGTSPANDLVLEVNTIDNLGAITSTIITGTPPGVINTYYLKIRGSTQFEVYENSLMTIPASGLDFPYVGFTTATATAVTASTDRVTVSDSSIFALYDAVVFTGTMFSSNIELGQTYYIKSIPTATSVTLSSTPGGSTLNITADASGSMTMAKAGSFAFLSEPFYFPASIIRYNNRLYECLVSNNDTEFVIGKWALVDSGDRRINALDRVVGYYQPTINMLGKDLTQLFYGVTYPNSTYKGNAFEPDQQFDLDVILQDQEFYPTGIQLNGIVYTDAYYAAGNLTDYSSLIFSENGTDWLNSKLTSSNINLTDIVYANGVYLMTSTNPTTPILRSTNGREWTSAGTFTPWGSGGWSVENYDMTSLDVSSLALESATYFNGWIAVGDKILHSDDTYSWAEVHTYPAGRDFQLYGVTVVNTGSFNGVVAVGQGSKLIFVDDFAEQIPTNLISYSIDGIGWTDGPTVTQKKLYAVGASSSLIVAAGEDGVIYYATNPNTWYGLNEASVSSYSSTNYIINISQSGFQVNDEIMFSETFGGLGAPGTVYYVDSVISPTLITIKDSPAGSIIVLTAGNVPDGTIAYGYDGNTIRDIVYSNGVWVSVGDNGIIKTSSDGLVWTTQTSGTTEDLNGISYSTTLETFLAVGDNNVILTSDDNGVTWTSVSLFDVAPPVHTVKGADFPYGYGPEELVPGVVRDSLALSVYTRPGTNWSEVEYAHVGYNVVSQEIAPTNIGQTIYTITTTVQYIAQVFVQVISASTGLGQTLYQGIDYTYDWQTNQIILNTPLTLLPLQKLRVDIYEVGNGEQLVKSSTNIDPIRLNEVTGFNEIYVNCNYTGTIYQGSGVVKPGTYDEAVIATATTSGSNRISMESVAGLTLGVPVTFSGDLLGGLEANVTYYVKTISAATGSITVSNYYDVETGVAGATIPLTTDSGLMYVNTSIGSDQVWTDPFLLNNGEHMLQGYSSQVTQTVASNNSVIANSTAGMVSGCKVTFSNAIFGGVLEPLTTYYVVDVLSATAFTLSTTQGGPVLALTDALGGAEYISYDYAFGIQPNGTSAKIVFAQNDLNVDTNYLVYSLFGETEPEQYGYTIPEVQMFVGDGSETEFALTNYVGGTNDVNAVVELDGVRQDPADYTIDFNTNLITFGTAPGLDVNIAVTTYHSTQRQYFHTQTETGIGVYNITNVNNTITPPLALAATTATIASTDGTRPNQIVCNSTTGFVINQRVEFHGSVGFGGLAVDGTIYYIKTIVDSTHFTISNTPGGTVKTLTTGSGSLVTTVGEQSAIVVTTSSATGFALNDVVRIDGVLGTTQLNNNTYYVRPITSTTFELYYSAYSAALNAANNPVTSASTYISGGYVWLAGQLYVNTCTATQTYADSPTFTGHSTILVNDTTELEYGTPIYFSSSSAVNGDTLIGDIVQGVEYYVSTVYSSTEFAISETRYGEEMVLTDGLGTLNVTQWDQQNVDRLWVTINGYRVPSSMLRLNDFNQLSILNNIVTSDVIIITSMMPSATPDSELYINFVDDLGIPSIYRVPACNRTYLIKDVFPLSTDIWVNNINCLVNISNYTVSAPAEVDGYYSIGISADKSQLKTVKVVNNTTGSVIAPSNVSVVLINDAPYIKIKSGSYITSGDNLTLTIYEGNNVYINGEQISYTGIDYEHNRLTGIIRGENGTSAQGYIPVYTQAIGLLNQNRMSEEYYDQTWNSYNFNTVEGDPLQISDTIPAYFLNTDHI